MSIIVNYFFSDIFQYVVSLLKVVGYELIREAVGLPPRIVGSQYTEGKGQPALLIVFTTLHVAPSGQAGLKKKKEKKWIL